MKKVLILFLIFFLSLSMISCEFDLDSIINEFMGETDNSQDKDPQGNKDKEPSGDTDKDKETDGDGGSQSGSEEGGSQSGSEEGGSQSGSDGGNGDSEDEEVTITIIEANDVHGYIMQDDNGRYGISNIAYVIDNIRNESEEDNVLLIANGDMFQGTGLVKMSYGRVMIDVMNEMGFDACCLGNHEFDWDLPVILQYFDGNEDNGEANFPLVNGNVYQDGKLVTIKNGKIYETYMFDKAGIKVGFIGFIGDVKSSINGIYADKYTFDTNFETTTRSLAYRLKNQGADIIVVSVHDGDSTGIANYNFNKTVANLKDGNGNYLIDAVINGHTHTYQSGTIERDNGAGLPVVQSNGYTSNHLYSFGRIDLKLVNKKVVSSTISHITSGNAGTNFNQNVEDIVQEYYQRDYDTLTETIVYSTGTIGKNQATYDWVTSCMLKATGADVAICNTGGIRTTISKSNIMFEDMYQFIPFDNEIIVHTSPAYQINNNILTYSGYFYGLKDGEQKTSGNYKVAIIDYVYYGSWYQRNISRTNIYDSNLILRDILIEDLKLRSSFNVNNDYESLLSLKINQYQKEIINIYYYKDKEYMYI